MENWGVFPKNAEYIVQKVLNHGSQRIMVMPHCLLLGQLGLRFTPRNVGQTANERSARGGTLRSSSIFEALLGGFRPLKLPCRWIRTLKSHPPRKGSHSATGTAQQHLVSLEFQVELIPWCFFQQQVWGFLFWGL